MEAAKPKITESKSSITKHENQLSVGIIAGGKSTRMGRDKALLRINGTCLLERLANELSGFSELLISAAGKGSYECFGHPVVYDKNREIGPIEGLRMILLNAKQSYVFVCATDLPNLKKEMVQFLSGFICSDYDCYAFQDKDYVHPLCAIYSKKVLPILEDMIRNGNYRLRSVLEQVRTKYVSLEHTCFSESSLKNVNSPKDFMDFLKPFIFCVSGFSNSGKTTLIERLIPKFEKDRMTVAVMKHDGHDALKAEKIHAPKYVEENDFDTERFHKAGALHTIVFSDSSRILHLSGEASPADLILELKKLKNRPDVIVLEGLKKSEYPKLEVLRKGIAEKPVCDPKTLICIASKDVTVNEAECPVIDLDDVDGIYYQIKQYFGI